MSVVGDEREWRRRLPRWLLTVLGYVILLPPFVAELAWEPSCSADDPCRDPLGSLTAALDAITFGAVLACLLMLVVAPRLIVWVAGFVAIACGVLTQIQLALQPMWVVAGAALLSSGTIDVLGRHHQTTIAAGWSTGTDPGLGATARTS